MITSFQRVGSKSNSHVGREFEVIAQNFFTSVGIKLTPNINIPVGIYLDKKDHSFDLGNLTEKILVECKSHKWTITGNVPSAKITVWNEAMFYFMASPNEYRKILFVLKDFNSKRGETLAQYYIRTYSHMIPATVEIWEYDEQISKAIKVFPK